MWINSSKYMYKQSRGSSYRCVYLHMSAFRYSRTGLRLLLAQRKDTVLKARRVSEELKVTYISLHTVYIIYNNFQSQISHY